MMKKYNYMMRVLACLLFCVALSGSAFSLWPFGPKKIKDKHPSEPTFDEYNQPDVRRRPVLDKAPKKEDEVSVERLEMLAKNGNPNAMLALGKMYFDGLAGLKQNYKKAFKLFEQASDMGNGIAMFNIGLCYDGGFYVKKNAKTALEWYTKAADLDVPEAQAKVAAIAEANGDFNTALYYLKLRADTGDIYSMRKTALFILNGMGKPEEPSLAVEYLKRASAKGDTRSQVRLADCYQRGLGTERNYEEMLNWLTIASQDGDPEAQAKLGYCYLNGIGVVKNTDIAARWFKLSAKAGYPPAQVAIGDCYMKGNGVPCDVTTATEYYRLAAEQGDSLGEASLAFAYLEGKGVQKDTQKAFDFMKKAASKGLPQAQTQLGIFHEEGIGTQKDYVEAVRCYRAAGDEPVALERLGICLAEGRGVTKDTKAAKEALQKAINLGNKDAKVSYHKLFDKQ